MNEAGLLKGKKTTRVTDSHGQISSVYQMEDENFAEYPFNEDIHVGLFCIFDGHAGNRAARAAKELVPRMINEKLEDCSESDLDFAQIFLAVDEQMASIPAIPPLQGRMFDYEGCTATTVLIWSNGTDRFVRSANVGDSSVILCHNGEAMVLSQDHRVTSSDERERLKNMGVKLTDNSKRLPSFGLGICRALGDFFAKDKQGGVIAEPFVSEVIKLTQEDLFLIIASDGLWDVLSPQEAVNLARTQSNAKDMASTLVKFVLDSKQCQDNITIIVVCI
eukprot:TRINITY_DN2363_c0_g5_i1.p1 TRINITY_DN2363_c0_g5~~TRINITY_DN2363_c0_g5_i1.p1  ORF type:complete len:314 (-),score=50.71 TRINITY_DN2363_c0_g5_i1:1285-2115(-)